MDYILNIGLGVLASLIASIVFWYLSFYYTGSEIKFSDEIEKSESKGEYPGDYRYRIRIKNIGRRNLIEVSILVKLTIGGNYTLLGIGNNNTLPIIPGKRTLSKYGNNQFSHTLTIFPNGVTMSEFKKSIYPESIVLKAKRQELSLDDIFSIKKEFKIDVYIFGNDSLTGVRKLYWKAYEENKIIKGDFCLDKSYMTIVPFED